MGSTVLKSFSLWLNVIDTGDLQLVNVFQNDCSQVQVNTWQLLQCKSVSTKVPRFDFSVYGKRPAHVRCNIQHFDRSVLRPDLGV